jgi:hypothetical protein
VITRYAAVTDAVLSALRSSQDLAGVLIVDGPPGSLTLAADFIYVGWTGSEDDELAGNISQAYHDLGPAATRDETVTIECIVQSVRGDDLMDVARLRCVTMLGAVETILRSDPTVGLAGLLRVELSDASVRQVRNADGIGVEISFTLEATSII